MFYGYDFRAWQEEGIRIRNNIPIKTHCNMLCVGSSGSGKSYALLTMLGSLVKEKESIDITFCDFKQSADFEFLQGYPKYFAGENTYDGIMDYYSDFTKARNGEEHIRHVLITDEYPSFLVYLQSIDKKKYNDVMAAYAQMLMLGRGTSNGFGIWTICQRPDSAFFSLGSRLNYMIFISLGHLTSETKKMMFEGEDIPIDTVYRQGEGLLLADGRRITEVKFPMIKDLDNWKSHIRQALLSSDEKVDVQLF